LQSVRNIAVALGTGAVAALVIDVLLRNALAAAQSPGASSMTPWWVVGRVLERSVWVVVALLLYSLAGAMARAAERTWPPGHVVSRAAAFDLVARLMIAAPLFWIVATFLVLAGRITLAGTWDVDGQMFATTSFYNNMVLGYLPWMGAGAILIALSRHAD
jgi:hypothetical protein